MKTKLLLFAGLAIVILAIISLFVLMNAGKTTPKIIPSILPLNSSVNCKESFKFENGICITEKSNFSCQGTISCSKGCSICRHLITASPYNLSLTEFRKIESDNITLNVTGVSWQSYVPCTEQTQPMQVVCGFTFNSTELETVSIIDECDIVHAPSPSRLLDTGDDSLVDETRKAKYPCEDNPNCEWRSIWARTANSSYYFCCPKWAISRHFENIRGHLEYLGIRPPDSLYRCLVEVSID